MTNISIIDETYTWVTREADPDYSWSQPSTQTSHDIKGFEVVKDESYYEFCVGFEPEPDRDYFLLFARYSTGNSFHREDGCIQFIDLYEDESLAKYCAQMIQDHYDTVVEPDEDFDAKFKVPIIYSNGHLGTIHPNWTGYFETFVCAEIEAVQMISPS